MGTDIELERRISQLGKGMVQVNLRLGRLVELLEQQPGATGGDGAAASAQPGAMDLLLDLLDAVEHTLAAHPTQLAVALPWWRRLLAAPAPQADLTGLSLARDHAVQQLGLVGILPAPAQGPADPHLHRVVEVRPTADPALDSTVAHTHRRGWFRRGDPPSVIRAAEITAWRHGEP